MVKIDAEGFDLKVLEGASDLLGRTDIFLVEVAICCAELENTHQSGAMDGRSGIPHCRYYRHESKSEVRSSLAL
jgi:hypothetical protein